MANDSKSTEKGTPGEMPFFDFTKLMSQFRLPGVDFAALVDRERKNIEALAEANRIAFEGWQPLARPIREIAIFWSDWCVRTPPLTRRTGLPSAFHRLTTGTLQRA